MPPLYPFLMLPFFSPRPWGARDLSPIYNLKPEKDPIGEAWLTGDDCQVANGPLRGQRLSDLCREYGRELTGDCSENPHRFPLLVKFLFPRDKLSVQVHPDDEGARQCGEPCGKTECWYVLAADPGAQIGLGLKPGTSLEELERAIRETRAEQLLNWIDIHAGEMYYVEAGTVHAIASGSILVETQQNSDTTYRLYDYGRGRELHIEQGLKATKPQTRAGRVLHSVGNGASGTLIAHPSFVVDKFRLEKPGEFAGSAKRRSPHILVAVDGCGVVESAGSEPVTFARGECVIVPASVREFRVVPQWTIEFLCSKLPAEKVSIPETVAS